MFSGDGEMGFSVSDVQQITSYGASHWAAHMTSMKGAFELDWRSKGAEASLDSSDVVICDVSGKLSENGKRERRFSSSGIATLPSRRGGPPVLRSISAVFDDGSAFFLNAYRPAVYHGHGDERNDAVLIEAGESRRATDVRLSTVYSKDDLHTQASVELFLEDDEFPRRLTGEAIEGTHVELTDRDVALAFYKWTLGPHTGVGYYEIALAAPPRRAA
ncbi:MAG: hypothetical protein HY827_06910 [Actinobacteria bacterium]|nr:hypothetical protein [Actinomycetota bacterium]